MVSYSFVLCSPLFFLCSFFSSIIVICCGTTTVCMEGLRHENYLGSYVCRTTTVMRTLWRNKNYSFSLLCMNAICIKDVIVEVDVVDVKALNNWLKTLLGQYKNLTCYYSCAKHMKLEQFHIQMLNRSTQNIDFTYGIEP